MASSGGRDDTGPSDGTGPAGTGETARRARPPALGHLPSARVARPRAVAAVCALGAACSVGTARGADARPDPTAALAIPVDGVARTALRDTYDAGRGTRRHEAIDIAAPTGTRVFAVDDGRLVKLFHSAAGGLTIYHFDPAQRVAYYYAHLDRYAAGVHEGMALKRCDLIGYVGTTGNAPADAPHLHFAIVRLGPERRWWQGTPINPYPWLHDAAPADGSAGPERPKAAATPCPPG